MFARRDNKADRDKKIATVSPVSGEQMERLPEMSLSEILHDPKEHVQFLNKYCYGKDPDLTKDIIDSLEQNNVLNGTQDAWLEKMRGEYNMRKLEVENIRQYLTPEDFKRIAAIDPRIGEVVGKIGPEKAEELIEGEFFDLLISDPKAFANMVRQLRAEKDLRERKDVKRLEKLVEGSLAKTGLTEDEFMDAGAAGSPADIEKRFRELTHEKMPAFLQAINFRNWLNKRAANELLLHYQDQETFLKESDKHLKSIGGILRGTLNADVKKAVQRYMLEGGSIEKKPEENVTTIEQYRLVKHENDSATIQAGFEAAKKAYNAAQKPGARVPEADWDKPAYSAKLDEVKDAYSEKLYRKQLKTKGAGAFGALLAYLFGSRTKDDIKNSLK